MEFRHDSWVTDDVFELLRGYNVAHVSVSSLIMPMNLTVTTNIVYARFHGLTGGAAHNYQRAELRPWAAHIRQQAAKGNRFLPILTMKRTCVRRLMQSFCCRRWQEAEGGRL